MDINPNYSMFLECLHVPKKIHSLYPDSKIIYLVRSPVSRLLSHIRHNLAESKKTRTLDAICDDIENGQDSFNYRGVSSYLSQISYFLEYFDRDQIYIISADSLRINRKQTLDELFEFLRLELFRDDSLFEHVCHTRQPRALNLLFHNRLTGRTAGWCVQTVKS